RRGDGGGPGRQDGHGDEAREGSVFRHLHRVSLAFPWHMPCSIRRRENATRVTPESRMIRPFRDERGVALVMAMLTLLILSVLVIAFSFLSSTEPTIASNQLRVAQARALAESGLEQAVW